MGGFGPLYRKIRLTLIVVCACLSYIHGIFSIYEIHQTISDELFIMEREEKPASTIRLVQQSKSTAPKIDFKLTTPDADPFMLLMKSRLDHIKSFCKSSPLPPYSPLVTHRLPEFLTINSLNALYLGIAKVGCTNWKKLIMKIEGDDKIDSIRYIPDWATQYGQRKMKEFKQFFKEDSEIINKRIKFVVVREPFDRLVSAYENKIEPDDDDHFGNMSKEISLKYRTDKSDFTSRPATFVEFLRLYVDPAAKVNCHWENFEKLVQPCQYKYDYILKIENIEEEATKLLERLNSKHLYPHGKKHMRSMTERVKRHLKNVDKNLLFKVFLKIKRDYEMFNYEFPDFLVFNKTSI